MNIAIIETHYHEEFVSTLCSLFDNTNITLFTTLKVKNNLPKETINKIRVLLCRQHNSKKSFIEDIQVDEFDKVFINTIQPSMADLPSWKNYPTSKNSILTMHNLNAWSNKSISLRWNLARTFDSFVASRYSDKILSKFGMINVVYESMLEHAISKFPQHRITNIPYALAQENVVADSHDTIDFVIPGTVANKRRDYKPVIETFDRLYETHKNIRLILLGELTINHQLGTKPYIISFDERVSDIEYNEYLRNVDFVITPSVEKIHIINMVDEYYGKTKSNNIHDAIKWRKPVIVPDYIPVPSVLTSSTLVYKDSSSLFTKLSYLLNNPEHIDSLKKEANKNCDWFSKKNVKERLQGEKIC